MPTWPTTTVPTTNLDSGSDEPRLARADLKTMADVVNSLVNYGTPSSGFNVILLEATSALGTLINSGLYKVSISESVDTGNLITVSSNQFSLSSGTYSVQACGVWANNGFSSAKITLRNTTDSSDTYDWTEWYPATGTFSQNGGGELTVITLTSTKTFEFRYTTDSGGTNPSGKMYFMITKYS